MENTPVQELLVVATQKYGVLNSAEKKLFTLAQEKFQELSDSEYELFRAIANGKTIDYRTGVGANDQPENASQWGVERILRGDRLRWLCIEPAVWQLCLPQGLDVAGAKIEGALNLSFSDVAIPLRFVGCSFTEAFRLQQTTLRRLDLSGTHLAASQIATVSTEAPVPTSIDAREVEVSGSILLLQGFVAGGTVILSGAKIEGNLDCSKGQFLQSTLALDLEGAAVKGRVNLSHNFEAQGTVILRGATIGNVLNCRNGKFLHTANALNANRVTVTGHVFLSDGFEAQGTVNLISATIGSVLNCINGKFLCAEIALNANRVNVSGAVFLSDGFEAQGTVDLGIATIGSVLDCRNGKFLHAEMALNANGAHVGGAVFLSDSFEAQGTVDLSGAKVGSFLDCSKGKFLRVATALNANSTQVSGYVLLSDGFEAQGRVELVGATIASLLQIVGIKESQDLSLNLQFAKVQTLEHAEDSFPASGKLKLNGLVYEAWGKKSPQSADKLLEWLRLQPKDAFSSQPYEQLAKVLRSTGRGDEAVEVLIGKERDQLQLGKLKGFSKFWKRVLGLTIAYGYRPQNAIYM